MEAMRAARTSVGIGILVLALKLVAWRLTGSVALYSDALESIVNVVAALVALTALRVAALPADANHPWGHSKAEYFSAGAEGGLIVVAAIAIISEASGKLFHPTELGSVGAGAIVSLVASGFNGALGLWLRKVGRRIGSPALEADGAHVMTDVLTTGGVLVGVVLAKLTGFWILDPLIAIGVALQIIYTGWKIVRGSVAGLMDEAVPASEAAKIEAVVREASARALEFHDLRARRAGARLFVELHLVVAGGMTVADSHTLCDDIEAAVRREFLGSEVTIHVEPESERRPAHAG